jgi:hypothetical protein
MINNIIPYLEGLIGNYTPVINNVVDDTGKVISSSIGVNYEYIVAGLLVILGVYCIFMTLVTLIKVLGGRK